MHMQEIRVIARQHGIKFQRQSKIKLIREIQREEGNFDCFAKAINNFCDQDHCLWRSDCFAAAKKQPS